ncbi:hypothetical protein NDU88_000314 [Pleurodeles waltl]|uniref:Uncharacterized protein n=1 Tax=Pleurodeles waltl TaxID=8319 RepID=A0AAV7LWH3_PLEWA|nr:hypothetical protein NDU88_000314 [Pleurodeles waltl]
MGSRCAAAISAEPTAQRGRSAEPTAQRGRSAEPTAQRSRSAEPTAQRSRSAEPTAQRSCSAEPTAQRGRFAEQVRTHRTREDEETWLPFMETTEEVKRQMSPASVPLAGGCFCSWGSGGRSGGVDKCGRYPDKLWGHEASRRLAGLGQGHMSLKPWYCWPETGT